MPILRIPIQVQEFDVPESVVTGIQFILLGRENLTNHRVNAIKYVRLTMNVSFTNAKHIVDHLVPRTLVRKPEKTLTEHFSEAAGISDVKPDGYDYHPYF